jgi:hypothetical protein
VEDKEKLLRPILSRFCEIYVAEPEYKNKTINLYKYNLEETFKFNIKNNRIEWLKKEIKKINSNTNDIDLLNFIINLYEKTYCALDILQLLEENFFKLTQEKKYELLIAFNKVKKEFRNEKLLLLFMFNFIFFDKTTQLENITFI